MSLRARLALIVGVMLAVVMLVVGGIAIQTTRDTLVGQVDEQVRVTAIRVQPDYEFGDVNAADDDSSAGTAGNPEDTVILNRNGAAATG